MKNNDICVLRTFFGILLFLTVASYQFFKIASILISHGLYSGKTFSINQRFPILKVNFSIAEIVQTIC